MKTITTTLPVYDKLSKQTFEKARHAGNDIPIPIVCPRHRLPSFQWLDESDGAASVSSISLEGSAYNIFDSWVNAGWFAIVQSSGLNVTYAKQLPASGTSYMETHDGGDAFHVVQTGDTIEVKDIFTRISGVIPVYIDIYDDGGAGVLNTALTSGLNTITYTVPFPKAGREEIYVTIHTGNAGLVEFSFTDVSIKVTNINSFFQALPVLAHDYFYYTGATLKFLLPVGVYYLKIVMNNGCIYYSDYFKVDCIYPNLVTTFVNVDFNTFTLDTTILTKIDNAIDTGAASANSSTYFSVTKGEIINVLLNLISATAATPSFSIVSDSLGVISNLGTTALGLNEVTLTTTAAADDCKIKISISGATTFVTTEILVFRDYSTKYLTVNFYNTCDLGDILYHPGFTQTLWLESEPMEPSFTHEEEGMNNGDGQFIRTFVRQVKKYLIRTKLMPAYMVEVFNRMKLHDTVELIDLVGDTNDVYNLEVEHEWYGEDKYYAKMDLTLDYNEAFVVAGCCNNLT